MANYKGLFFKQNLIASLIVFLCAVFVWFISPDITAQPQGILSLKEPKKTPISTHDVQVFKYTPTLTMPTNSKYIGVLNAQIYGQGQEVVDKLALYLKNQIAQAGANGLLILMRQHQSDGVYTVIGHVYQL